LWLFAKRPGLTSLVFFILLLDPYASQAQSADGLVSKSDSEAPSFWEFQMRGSLVDVPLWVPGYGILAVTNDRRANLYTPGADTSLHWSLPRLGEGIPSYGLQGLLLVPQVSGRVSLINVEGYIIRSLRRPVAEDGVWLLGETGRLYFLGKTRFIVMSPQGNIISNISHNIDLLSYTWPPSPGSNCFVLGRENSELIILDLSMSLRRISAGTETRSWNLFTRPGKYEVEYTDSRIHFSYEAHSQPGPVRFFPEPGILSWSDERWKLFLKYLPVALPPAWPQAQGPDSGVKGNDVKELNFLFQSSMVNPSLFKDFFLFRMQNPRNLDWLALLIKDILSSQSLIKAPQVRLPSFRLAALEIARDLLVVQDANWLALQLLNPEIDVLATLSMIESLATDPRATMAEALRALSVRSTTTKHLQLRIRDVLQALGPSLPATWRKNYLFLMASLPKQ
jgi:hypothetical protein